jgi:hypothetical protein
MAEQEFDNKTPFSFHPLGSHSSTVDYSSAVTPTIPAGADRVMIQAITQNVRITLDGTAPTAVLGFQIKAGEYPGVFPLHNETVLKIIEEAATAVVQLQFGF